MARKISGTFWTQFNCNETEYDFQQRFYNLELYVE